MKGGTRGRTALHYSSSNGHAPIVQLLLAAGAHEYIRDIGGYTPLNLSQGDTCQLLHSVSVNNDECMSSFVDIMCYCPLEATVLVYCCTEW